VAQERDRLGRVRRPGQGRGLRPLHPRLPQRWVSRAIRVAMSHGDWHRFESLVADHSRAGESEARRRGEALSSLLREADVTRGARSAPLAWIDWEASKAVRLLWRDRACG
jgi:hypothetical protein